MSKGFYVLFIVYSCKSVPLLLVLIFQLQIILMALIDDRNFNEILDHTNLSTCQSLFQQCQILLRLESLAIFFH